MRKSDIALAACAAILATAIAANVSAPIRFEKERQRREACVKQRLRTISEAERLHHELYNHYAGNLQTLVGQGLMADSVRYIPYSGGKSFHLSAGMKPTPEGDTIHVMECGALYADYLNGMDRRYVESLTSDAVAKGRYPGLKTHDMTTP